MVQVGYRTGNQQSVGNTELGQKQNRTGAENEIIIRPSRGSPQTTGYAMPENGIWSGSLFPGGIIRYELFCAETITFHSCPTACSFVCRLSLPGIRPDP